MEDKIMSLALSMTNEMVCKKARLASSFSSRLKGLMFSTELPKCDGLLLTSCRSIHTFFMLYSIDVVFLDKNFKVVKVIYNMKPWKMTWIYFKAYQVLEMKAGTLKKNLVVGECLQVKYV